MPTGLTAPIYEGKEDFTFEDFALRCARQFGVFILQRDDPADTPAKSRFEVDAYHTGRVTTARAKLTELESMPEDVVMDRAEHAARMEQERYEEALAKDEDMAERYDAMIARTEAWKPSDKWERLREFMLKQLRESKEFDCGVSEYMKPKNRNAGEWYADELEAAQKELMRAEQSLAEETERQAERTEWAQQLYVDLGIEVPA